jgi:hypothetical protein
MCCYRCLPLAKIQNMTPILSYGYSTCQRAEAFPAMSLANQPILSVLVKVMKRTNFGDCSRLPLTRKKIA